MLRVVVARRMFCTPRWMSLKNFEEVPPISMVFPDFAE
jgi:hypothetical protein